MSDNLAGMHFFLMVSKRDYSETGINGLYVSDHPIEQDEYAQYLADWYRDRNAKFAALRARKALDVEFMALQNTADAQGDFVKLHNMRPVAYTEFDD